MTPRGRTHAATPPVNTLAGWSRFCTWGPRPTTAPTREILSPVQNALNRNANRAILYHVTAPSGAFGQREIQANWQSEAGRANVNLATENRSLYVCQRGSASKVVRPESASRRGHQAYRLAGAEERDGRGGRNAEAGAPGGETADELLVPAPRRVPPVPAVPRHATAGSGQGLRGARGLYHGLGQVNTGVGVTAASLAAPSQRCSSPPFLLPSFLPPVSSVWRASLSELVAEP